MTAQAHIFTGTEISTGRRKPSEIVAEYDAKREALAGALAEFEAAGTTLKSAATIGGTWGNVTLDTGRGIYPSTLEKSLLQSAWRHVYDLYGLDQIASASAKRVYEQMFSAPPPFTVENIRDKFGDLVSDPHGRVKRSHRVLKYHRNVFSSDLRHLVLAVLQQVLPVEPYFAADFHLFVGEQSHKGLGSHCLPTAGFPDQSKCLALFELEADPPDSLHNAGVCLERHK